MCVFFENGPLYTQSDSTMIVKWPSSDPKSPTDTQTDPKVTPKWSGSDNCSFSWNAFGFLDKQNPSQKWIYFVYGPVWDEQWHHQTRNYTHHTCHSTSICPKLPQSDLTVDPKSRSYAKKPSKPTPNQLHIFIKSLKYVGKTNVFWKRTLIYPKWLHNDCEVTI